MSRDIPGALHNELNARIDDQAAETQNRLNAISPVRVTEDYIAANKTYTEQPSEVFAGSAKLAGRTWITLRNMSTSVRLRFGVQQANLQRDGFELEPQSAAVLRIEPETDLFACSEGKPIIAHVGEDTGHV